MTDPAPPTEAFGYFVGDCQRLGDIYFTYVRLAETQESRDLLNRLAPRLFVEVLDVYWVAFHLLLARILDRASNGADKNLSVERFYGYADTTGKASASLTDTRDRLEQLAAKLRAHRHKMIAHSDEKSIVGKKRLLEIPDGEIEAALVDLQEFVDEFTDLLGLKRFRRIVPKDKAQHVGAFFDWIAEIDFEDVTAMARVEQSEAQRLIRSLGR